MTWSKAAQRAGGRASAEARRRKAKATRKFPGVYNFGLKGGSGRTKALFKAIKGPKATRKMPFGARVMMGAGTKVFRNVKSGPFLRDRPRAASYMLSRAKGHLKGSIYGSGGRIRGRRSARI
jgi:hypothetical protein